MFSHRLSLRRWAARVLLLWLLGIAAGTAHACIGAVAASPQHHACADAAKASQVKSVCKDFCDKAGVSIPPLKWAVDDAQVHALALLAVTAVMPVPGPAPLAPRPSRDGGVRPPTIPIAFLRLAL